MEAMEAMEAAAMEAAAATELLLSVVLCSLFPFPKCCFSTVVIVVGVTPFVGVRKLESKCNLNQSQLNIRKKNRLLPNKRCADRILKYS